MVDPKYRFNFATQTASKVMIGQGIEGGLGSFASGETTPFLARDEAADPMQSMVRDDNEDTVLVQMSFHIDDALSPQLSGLCAPSSQCQRQLFFTCFSRLSRFLFSLFQSQILRAHSPKRRRSRYFAQTCRKHSWPRKRLHTPPP